MDSSKVQISSAERFTTLFTQSEKQVGMFVVRLGAAEGGSDVQVMVNVGRRGSYSETLHAGDSLVLMAPTVSARLVDAAGESKGATVSCELLGWELAATK